MASWELLKENIQPLKQGRKVSSIEQPDQKKIFEEKQAFETALRTYNGSDPLDPWFKYITWVEQTYPRGGKEGNLNSLLEKCIREFKDDTSVHQDERYLEVWIKYANFSQNALEIYKYMHAQGVATHLSAFYINWAWELEQVGNYKRAESTFNDGYNQAQDGHKDILETKHKQFQARVMKRMLEKSPEKPTTKEDERSVLGSLKGHGKHQQKVGSVRVGGAKKSEGPGTLQSSSTKPVKNQKQFSIFTDETESNNDFVSAAAAGGSLPFGKERRKENEQEAGKWTQARVGKKSHAVSLDQISIKPSFDVHEDEEETPQKNYFCSNTINSNVLSAKKPAKEAEDHYYVPLALFEPPDATKIPMYCKHHVYQGLTEFSFEELRGIRYKKRMADRELEKKRVEMDLLQMQMMEKQAEFVRQQEVMRREHEEAMRQQKLEMEQAIAKQKQELRRQMLLQEQQLKVQQQPEKPVRKNFHIYSSDNENSRSKSTSDLLEDTKALLQTNPVGGGSSSNSSTPPRISMNNMMVQPSPTVNTKEALSLMREMWGKEPTGNLNQFKESGPEEKKKTSFEVFCDENAFQKPKLFNKKSEPEKKAFEVFCDEKTKLESAPEKKTTFEVFCDQEEDHKKKKPFAVFSDDEKAKLENEHEKKTFEVFCDQEEGHQKKRPFAVFCEAKLKSEPEEKNFQEEEGHKKNNGPFPVFCDEDIQDEDDFKENVRPSGTAIPEPSSSRSKSGILTESKNVPFVPLAQQIEDEEEEEERNATSTTMRVPSMEAFAEMARAASTPFHGRPFMPEDDDNTCSVDILFKKPALPATAVPQSKVDPLLSPIMETSREMYKSSSTSSSNASQSHFTKSHWGNTITSEKVVVDTKNTPFSASSSSKTLKPVEMTTSSGYMADSSRQTPGTFLAHHKNEGPKKKAKLDFLEEEEEEEEEPTGLFNDMMNEFQKGAGLTASDRKKSSFLQQSLKASFLEPEMLANNDASTKKSPQLNFSTASFSQDFSRPTTGSLSPCLELSSHKRPENPCLELSSRPENGDLSLMKQPCLELSSRPEKGDLSLMKLSSRPEKGDLSLMELSSRPAAESVPDLSNLSIVEVEDPFSDELHMKLLSMISEPLKSRHGYLDVKGQNVPLIRSNSSVQIGPHDEFLVMECKGEGGYGKVFKAFKKNDVNPNETIADMDVVLKVQKPAREWEFYICTELHKRLKKEEAEQWFMSIPRCYVFDDGSVFVSEHQNLSLLDVCNRISKMDRLHVEPLAIYFTIEMLLVLAKLRKAQIVHADLKPDNFLIQRMPKIEMVGKKPCLQLIDFGVSIDTSLFEKGTEFSHKFEKNKCPEMMEGKKWNYQLDYYGVAGISYTLLHGTYMKLVKSKGKYGTSESLRRWWNRDLWSDYFQQFLNIESSTSLPDLEQMRGKFEDYLFNTYGNTFAMPAAELNCLFRR